MKNYVLKFGIVLTLIVVGLLGIFNTSLAQSPPSDPGIIDVEYWDGDSYEQLDTQALFNVDNFLPGDIATSTIRVKNTTTSEALIQMSGSNTSENPEGPSLAGMLNFKISNKDGSAVYYGNNWSQTLSEFLAESGYGVELSTIPAGDSAKYLLTVQFKPQAGNDYQNTSTTFDFEIGFYGEVVGDEEGTGDGDGGHGDGGDGGGSTGYFGPEDEKINIINVGNTTPTTTETDAGMFESDITWNTTDENGDNLKTYGAIVYGQTSIADDDLGGYPKYGYDFRVNDENDEKMTTHTVTATGLESDTTYHYRVIAWASPYIASEEHSFKTPAKEEQPPGEEPGEGEEGAPGEEGAAGPGEPTIGPTGPIAQAGPGGEGTTDNEQLNPDQDTTEEVDEETTDNGPSSAEATEGQATERPQNFLANLQAALGGIFGKCVECLPWWLLLVFALVTAWMGYREKEETKTKIWYLLAGLEAILALILYGFGVLCVRIVIFAAVALVKLLAWYAMRKDSNRRSMLMIAGLLTIVIIVAIKWLAGCVESWILVLILALYAAGANSLHRKLE